MRSITRLLLLGSLAALTFAADVAAQTPAVTAAAVDAIYAQARPKLLQVRTLVAGTGEQSSIGSGFLISAEGHALTNYHVVAQHALEPEAFALEYAAPDGTRGLLQLLAFDIVNDLAVVKLPAGEWAHFEFDPRAVADTLPKGERLFAMGNPLDLGFTIVEGIYNGAVERSYNPRIHFSGALNPGMSGGPTVSSDGRVAGINVAKSLGGDLVSFLVPVQFAQPLLERARVADPLSAERTRTEIANQLGAWQNGLFASIDQHRFRTNGYGPYQAEMSAAPWFSCWASTNAERGSKRRVRTQTTQCAMQSSIFVSDDLETGQISFVQEYARSEGLNPFQFAVHLSREYMPISRAIDSSQRMTAFECTDDFVASGGDVQGPPLHAAWCARAYRDFPDLYDVTVAAVTQDRSGEALISHLTMFGVAHGNAKALAERFLSGIEWTP